MTLPVSDLKGPIRALFTDLDGTATTGGRLEAETFAALDRLRRASVEVVIVTGRSAGWGQALAALGPFAAVVTENGGVTFAHTETGLQKFYGVPTESLPEWRARMQKAASAAMALVPGARLSNDSVFREVDLAIDWNEEVHLERSAADRMVENLRQAGLNASRSNVHVNFAPPGFDKFSASREVIKRILAGDPDDLSGYVYVGDSLNDAPMFAGFAKSVGVTNIQPIWNDLPHRPRYLTAAAEGAGLREVVEHLLSIS